MSASSGKWLKRAGLIGGAYCAYEGFYRAYCMASFNSMMANEFESKTLRE